MRLTHSRSTLFFTILATLCTMQMALGEIKVAQRKRGKELPANVPLKRNRTATLNVKSKDKERSKVGPKLRNALMVAEKKGGTAALKALNVAGATTGKNSTLVPVVIRPSKNADAATLNTQLTAAGAVISRAGKDSVKAFIPLAKLETAAALTQVNHIRALAPPRKKALTGEGVAATFADSWHGFGFTGQNTDVAVVDTGYMDLAYLISVDDLPANYIPVNFSTDPDIGDTDLHGSACAEIIYDLAPDARLHLIKIDDISDLVEVANYCITAGVDTVSISLGWDVINFHDGMVYDNWLTGISDHPVTAVNQMNAAGVLCSVAAGNEQEQHSLINWSSSGDYLLWDDEDTDLNLLYSYENETTTFNVGETITVLMTWNRWPVTDKDFDLYLIFNDGSGWIQVDASQEIQDGTPGSYPVEGIIHEVEESGEYAVEVVRYENTDTPWIILRYYGVLYPYYWEYNNYLAPAPGSLSIPGDAAASFSVGAIDFLNYPGGPIDYYSSLGPNNRAYTGGTAVTKPDICAPAGISSEAYEDYFSGTSAAAPHIAGLAALVKGVYPTWSLEQIKEYIEKNGFDIAPPGKDNTFGSGAAQLPTSLTVIESDALNVTAISNASGSATLQVTGLIGEIYSVQARNSLTTGTWLSIGTVPISTGGTGTFTDPGPLPPKRFYKLVKL